MRYLRRINPERNMARFYSMDIERDLFGHVILVRRWGRIGTAGRTREEEHPDEGRAVAALVKLESRKQRHGYGAPPCRRGRPEEMFP